jgi:hypothetical protein
MKIITLKVALLIVMIQTGNACFSQTNKIIYFAFDSASLKEDQGALYKNDYYKDYIIRHKVFFNEQKNTVKKEFIRIEKNKYQYFLYDTTGKIQDQGTLVLQQTAFVKDSIPVIDSIGELSRYEVYEDYIFYKDEDWTENIDSVTYAEGRYKLGKKDSVWLEIKNNQFIERQLFYQNGVLKKTEVVNQIYNTNAEKIKTLCKKWGLLNTSANIANLATENAGGNNLKAGIEFKKDGTYFSHYRGIEDGKHESGTWTIKNNVITMVSDKKTSIAVVNYLSDTYLSLAYQQ